MDGIGAKTGPLCAETKIFQESIHCIRKKLKMRLIKLLGNHLNLLCFIFFSTRVFVCLKCFNFFFNPTKRMLIKSHLMFIPTSIRTFQ